MYVARKAATGSPPPVPVMAAAQGPLLLPDDVLADILARLPRSSFGSFRAVCRDWKAIASGPSADRLFAKRPAAVTAITKEIRSVEVDDDRRPVDIVRFDFFRGRWYPDIHNRKKDPCPRTVSLDDMIISAKTFRSWDGVLCARIFPAGKPQPGAGAGADYVLWNPLTNACAVVSAPAGEGRIIGGYAHPTTGRVHLLHSSDDVAVPRHRDLVIPITARILTVGDGTGWREIPLPASSLSMMGERDHSVSLHGNLHWLVQPAGSGKAALLVFDTGREEFRLMAAPERPGLDPKTARSRVVPGGKLCVLALTQQQQQRPVAQLEVWVLDDYSDTRSWRLRETVCLHAIRLPPRSDWPRWFFAATAAVEVVEGVHEGEEILIQHEHGILAYSVRRKEWRNVSVGRSCAALLMYRESIMRPEISFGKALRLFRRRTASRRPRYGHGIRRRSYSCFGSPLEGSAGDS